MSKSNVIQLHPRQVLNTQLSNPTESEDVGVLYRDTETQAGSSELDNLSTEGLEFLQALLAQENDEVQYPRPAY